MGARAWPFGGLCPSPDCLGCGTRCAQTVLATQLDFGTGAQPRPQAPGNGAMRSRGYNFPLLCSGAISWRCPLAA